jgi:hypothetical protein
MALGRQFDLYVDHQDYGRHEGRTSQYSLAKQHDPGDMLDPDNDWEGPTPASTHADVRGRVYVTHNSTSPTKVETWNRELYGHELTQPREGQQRLLKEHYDSKEPGRSVVDGMFFTKDARTMAMPMLALAARDTAEQLGRHLVPSGDRSAHSEKLVQKLASQGMIDPHERKDSNSISFQDAQVMRKINLGDPADPSLLDAGKSTVRDMIRRAPGRKRRTDGEQLPLF